MNKLILQQHEMFDEMSRYMTLYGKAKEKNLELVINKTGNARYPYGFAFVAYAGAFTIILEKDGSAYYRPKVYTGERNAILQEATKRITSIEKAEEVIEGIQAFICPKFYGIVTETCNAVEPLPEAYKALESFAHFNGISYEKIFTVEELAMSTYDIGHGFGNGLWEAALRCLINANGIFCVSSADNVDIDWEIAFEQQAWVDCCSLLIADELLFYNF